MAALSSSMTPFEILQALDARSRQKAFGLPQKAEVRRTWSGIGFRLGGQQLVTSTDSVTEILRFPPLTGVPGALPWVKGIANIRGTLIPILDLNGFISSENTHLDRKTRVLIINRDGMQSGLVVDEVMGLRYFFEEDRVDTGTLSAASDNLKHFLSGAFRQSDTGWGIFDMSSLTKSPKFIEVAAQA